MQSGSNYEIPPVARTGRTSALSLPRSLLGPWLWRNALLGAASGFVLAIAAQIAVSVVGIRGLASGQLQFEHRALGVLLTGAVYAGALVVAAGIGGLWIRRPAGRTIALATSTATLTMLFVWHTISVVVRILAGAHVTVGAVDFFINSAEHMVQAVLSGYWLHMVVLGGVAAAVATLAARWLRRGLDDSPHPPSRQAVGALGALALLAGLGALPGSDGETLGQVWRTTPELAMIDSIHDEVWETYQVSAEAQGPVTEVTPGPPRSAEEIWRRTTSAYRTSRPNVLLLMLESVSARHVGYLGYDRGTTPNLDRLASGSLRMRRAWTTATHSNYAQMAVLSSLFPRRGTGLDVYRRLDYPRVLLHDLFDHLGYETATISSQDETWQGMLRFQQTETQTHYQHAHDHEGPFVNTGSEQVVPDHITAQYAIDWIEQQRIKKWSLYVNFQMTHFPYKLPPSTPKRFEKTAVTPGKFNYFGYPKADRQAVINRYDNALAYVDEQIGALRDYLSSAGLLENTLWVITSDHGELFHEHGVVTHGKTLYEEEARVPLLVHWPRRVRPGDVDVPVSTLDVLPTIADLVDVPPHPSFQGRSFADPKGRAEGDMGIFMNNQGLRSLDGLICFPWKLVIDRKARKLILFNLEDDPGESKDLASAHSDIAFKLSQTLRAQMKAQQRYHHAKSTEERRTTFAPRLLSCPSLTAPATAR